MLRPVGLTSLRKNVQKENMRVVPIAKLSYLNPIAAQIKKKLGKNYGVVSFATAQPSRFKKDGISSVIYTKNEKDVHGPKEGVFYLTVDNSLMRVDRDVENKKVWIVVNSRVDNIKYTPETVIKAKKAVEESLGSRGLGFLKESHGDERTKNRYTLYKMGGRKKSQVDYAIYKGGKRQIIFYHQ
jgi:hypothetical protein